MRDFFRYDFRLNRDPDTIRITIDWLSQHHRGRLRHSIATSDSMATRRNKNPPTGFLFDIFFFGGRGPSTFGSVRNRDIVMQQSVLILTCDACGRGSPFFSWDGLNYSTPLVYAFMPLRL